MTKATHHWQVTVRSVGDSAPVEAAIAETILPLIKGVESASHVALAGCINCAGEFTYMAGWTSADEVVSLESSEAYRAALASLEAHLRVPPKRELWRLLG